MQNQYATGKNVYFGGLPNAQSGTLNPDGYIKRESQRRSGLAAVALARRDGQKSKVPGITTNTQATVTGNLPGPKTFKKSLNLSGLFVDPAGKLGRLG